MPSRRHSSESDPFEVEELYQSTRSRRRSSTASIKKAPPNSRVEHLTTKLQDTNRNLKVVDKMLGEYRDLGDQQSANMDRMKEDLIRTNDELYSERLRQSLKESTQSLRASDLDEPRDRRRRRLPTSPLRDHEKASSDREYGRSRSGVRFHDDMDAGNHIHGLHQTIRDLASEQLRMDEELHREVDRRKRLESESRRTFSELRNTLRNPDTASQAVGSVDRRLQSVQAELQAERNLLKKQQAETGVISTELKQALLGQPGSTSAIPVNSDSDVRARLMQTESLKHELENELDKVRRRMDQAEGGRDALMDQIEDLRKQVFVAEQDRLKLQLLVEDQEKDLSESKHKRLSAEKELERWDVDKRRMEEDLREMRSQLTKSASAVGDYGDVRRELERSEKQRTQLSDHIQVLNKDLEAKERSQTKVAGQLQEMTEKFQETDRQKHQSLLQLEDALKRLRDTTREAENLGSDFRDYQTRLEESERKREEIKARAQETVRQWKLKCKKIERDVEQHQQHARQTTERNEQLIKDVENFRSQSANGAHQMEHMKRELGEILAMRAQQDEQLRLRDIENNELKAFKMDLERDLRDCKMVIDRLEQELRMATEKNTHLFEEKNKLEDQMGAMHSGQLMMQNQMHHMQKELREFGNQKVDLSAQVADMAHERQELRSSLQDSQKAEGRAKEEIEILMKRMQEEKETNTSRMDAVKTELDQYKRHESHVVSDLTRRFKTDQAQYEAEIQALKLEVQEDKSSMKMMRKQMEKFKDEMENLHQQLGHSKEETETAMKKYQRLKTHVDTKTAATEDGLYRAKEVEQELLESCESLRRQEKDFQNILFSIGAEVDSLLEIVAAESFGMYKAVAGSAVQTSEPQKWMAELKSKIEWVRSEFREKRSQERQLRTTIRDNVESSEKDRQFLIKELARQNNVLDELAQRRKELTQSVKEHDVDETLENLSPIKNELESLHESLLIEQEAILKKADELSREEAKFINNAPALKESQHEREKIHERYAKLQDTLALLKQELHDTRKLSELFQPITPNGKLSKNNGHVRISSPPVQEYDVAGNITDLDTPSPSPLTLNDKEFHSKFLLKKC